MTSVKSLKTAEAETRQLDAAVFDVPPPTGAPSADAGRGAPGPRADAAPDGVSVVVPVLNERDNVVPLLDETVAALEGRFPFEVIFVDDGSTDGTQEVLAAARESRPGLRILRHGRNGGQSQAIRTGVAAARFGIVVTMDGDGQNDPADIPCLVERLVTAENESAGPRPWRMVSGHRTHRRDSLIKRLSSSLANGVRRRLLDDGTTDTGCSLKAFRRDLFLALPYFDHMHRYLPALVRREGGSLDFVPVSHRPRRSGRSKYGVFDRLWVSLIDVLGVMWLQRRCKRPVERVEL